MPLRKVPFGAGVYTTPSLAMNTFGGAELGDIAEHVAHQAVVEAARLRLDQARANCWDRGSRPWRRPGRIPRSAGGSGESVIEMPVGFGIGAS